MQNLTRVSSIVVLLVALLGSAQAFATDYVARKSGAWSDARVWQPRGVPGIGDRVQGIGRHTITVDSAVTIGRGQSGPALVLNGAGELVLADRAQLEVRGHLAMTGEGAKLRIGKSAELLFASGAEQVLQLQLFGAGQRLTFTGAPGERGKIGLAPDSEGHWFVASDGQRDSVLAGAYGQICDALDPESGKGWTMYLANDLIRSRLVARMIEFRHSGQISVFGLDAGENTTVDIRGWTFVDSHPQAASLPAFWIDGYGDVVVSAQPTKAKKRIRDLVSDKEIYARYLQDYELDTWILGAGGKAGSVRAGNNGGNAKIQKNLFQVVRDSGGVGLMADETNTVYMYAEADNPHGFDTRHLRGDASLTNFWFESNYPNQSDTGDAILTNGPQSWVAEHGGDPVLLTVTHSGSIGDTSAAPSHPVFLTLNDATGMRFDLRNNFMRQPVRFNAVALDENGASPTGTGVAFEHNIVYSPQPVPGYALGSAAGKRAVHPDVFRKVDHNLYYNLQPREGGYPTGVHAMTVSGTVDANSSRVDPQLRDNRRSFASWDRLMGGPGTAKHAIRELQKLNDDEGYDPAYRVDALVSYVAKGYVPTNPQLLDAQGLPIVGPRLAAAKRTTRAAPATD